MSIAIENDAMFHDLQNKLFAAYLDFESLDRVCEIISDHLGYDFSIVDTLYEELGCTKHRKLHVHEMPPLSAYRLKINVETEVALYGFLLANPPEELDIETESTLLRQCVIMTIVLWFDRLTTIQASNQRFRDSMLWSIISDEQPLTSAIKSDGQALGLFQVNSYICITGRIGVFDGEIQRSKADERQWFIKSLVTIQNHTQKSADKMNRHVMFTYQQDVYIIFLEYRQCDTEQFVYFFLNSLESKLKHIFGNVRFAWGIGEVPNGPTDFHCSYINSRLALDTCYSENGFGHRYSYKDARLFQMIYVLKQHPNIVTMSDRALKSLLEYDKKKDSSLLETFRCYMQNNHNIAKTAQMLFLHRQTLLYRLKKIESLTGISLSNHEETLFLEVCVKIYCDACCC